MKSVLRLAAALLLVLVALVGVGYVVLFGSLIPVWTLVLGACLVAGAFLFFWLRKRRAGGPSESAGVAGKVGLL